LSFAVSLAAEAADDAAMRQLHSEYDATQPSISLMSRV